MSSTIQAVVVTALIVIGSFFLLVGTIGLLRFPNVYNRLHATSKAATLGTSSMLLASAVHFGAAGDSLTALVGIVFLFFTAPTGGHVISRAAQKMGVPFVESADWPGISDADRPDASGGEMSGPDVPGGRTSEEPGDR